MSGIRKIEGRDGASYEEMLNKMFEGTDSPQSQSVDLPSMSRFYKSSGEVVVSPLTFEEEERILSSKGKGTDIINLILGRCHTVLPISLI